MLWIGLMARDSGVPASKRLGIRDAVLALDFDRAVSLRLLRYDDDRAKQQARLIASEVGRLFNGDASDDWEVGNDVHDLIKDDPYADQNTIVN